MQGRPADGQDGFDENQPLSQKEIQARIVASDVATTFSTDLVDLRYAFLSQRGYYPDCNIPARPDTPSSARAHARPPANHRKANIFLYAHTSSTDSPRQG